MNLLDAMNVARACSRCGHEKLLKYNIHFDKKNNMRPHPSNADTQTRNNPAEIIKPKTKHEEINNTCKLSTISMTKRTAC